MNFYGLSSSILTFFSAMLKTTMDTGIELIRAKRGAMSEIARQLGLSKQAVTQWERVPDSHLGRVSDIVQIPPWELRPDLYRSRDNSIVT